MSRSPKPRARRAPISRRLAIAAGLSAPVAARAAVTQASSGDREVARLVERAARANAAFMRGDMTRWFDIASPIAGDFTLMQPFGGAPTRGFDGSPKHLEALSRDFRNGKTELELVEAYATRDLVVLVMIERQRGEVGGLPEQDWSLRVSQVYRRSGGQWQLVHRHADPLVRNIGLERAAAIAR